MPQVFQEQELQFQFPDALPVEELDRQGVPIPVGMALVDLVIEEDVRTLLLEVKDPSNSRVPEDERKRYIKRIQNDSLISDELTPKARDSYTYLHLMKRDSKSVVYVVLLGIDAFADEKAILLGFKDRLLQRIRHEAESPWKREYVQDCVVVSLDEWNKRFPKWPVTRRNVGGGF